MTDDRLEAIRARAEAATLGPWWVTEDLDGGDDDPAVGVAAGPEEGYRSIVVMTPGSASFDAGEPTAREADAAFIAHARQDVPWLIEQVHTWRQSYQQLRSSAARPASADANSAPPARPDHEHRRE